MRTLRRHLVVLLLAVFVVLGTGCGALAGTITVNPDDTADVRLDASVPHDDAILRAQMLDACKPVLSPKPKPYENRNGRTGCVIEGHLNPTKMATLGMSVHTKDGRQHFSFQGPTAGDHAKSPVDGAYQKLVATGDIDLKVSFRGKVLSHSGSSTLDGRTVEWRKAAELADGLKAEAEEPGIFDRTPGEWALVAAFFLGLAAYAVWIIRDVRARRPLTHRAPWGGPAYARPEHAPKRPPTPPVDSSPVPSASPATASGDAPESADAADAPR